MTDLAIESGEEGFELPADISQRPPSRSACSCRPRTARSSISRCRPSPPTWGRRGLCHLGRERVSGGQRGDHADLRLLGSRIGERRFYTIGLVLFTISSLGCGLAPTFATLVAMRVIQGISYAVLISVGYGLYRVIFPPSSLGTILGLNALTFAVGTALGPLVGGLIVSYASWPWLLYINLPSIAAIAFSIIALGKDTHKEHGFDVLGAVTSAAAFGLFALAVDQIGRWSHRTVLLLTAAAAMLMVAFGIGGAGQNPLLPLDIFHSRRYTFAVLTSVTMFVSQGMA